MADKENQEWKNSYYDCLDQLEKQDKSWQKARTALQRGFSRLTTQLELDPSDAITEINDLSRNVELQQADKQVAELFDTAIGELKKQLHAVKSKKNYHTNEVTETLRQLSETIQFPASTGPMQQIFRQELQQRSPDDVVPIRLAFQQLIESAIHAEPIPLVDPNSQIVLGGSEPPVTKLDTAKLLLSRLTHELLHGVPQEKKFSQRIQLSSKQEELFDLIHELGQLLRQAPLILPESNLHNLPPNEVLIRLLERLDIPVELQDNLEKVKKRLLKGLTTADVESTLKMIADLIQAMRNRTQQEKSELKDFLQTLTSHLQELNGHISAQMNANVATRQASSSLEQAVQQNVQQLQQSVNEAHSLGDIKATVTMQLSAIKDHINEFRQQESKRLQHAEQEIAALNDKLTVVKNNSSRLQSQIMQQRQQALVDALTSIPNRLAYNERIEQEMERWKRYKHPLSIAIWDIDNFKNVNDSYGHQAGDKVLTVVAKLLKKQVRKTDFVARFGGEEFVLLMPETPLDIAFKVADALRQKVEQCEFHFRRQRVPVTISCGLAQFNANDSAEKAFKRADDALYVSKKSGRNRCSTEQDIT